MKVINCALYDVCACAFFLKRKAEQAVRFGCVYQLMAEKKERAEKVCVKSKSFEDLLNKAQPHTQCFRLRIR